MDKRPLSIFDLVLDRKQARHTIDYLPEQQNVSEYEKFVKTIQVKQYQNVSIEKRQRISIFNDIQLPGAVRRRRYLTFEQICAVQYLNQYQQCQCQSSLQSCPKLSQILEKQRIPQAKTKYQDIKLQVLKKLSEQTKNMLLNKIGKLIKQNRKLIPQVLQIPFRNLMILVQTDQFRPLLTILRHTKVQYLAFWVYSKLCLRWPNKDEFIDNISKIADLNNCKFSFEMDKVEQFYNSKGASLISFKYVIFLRLLFKEVQFAQRVAVAALMKGRQRTDDQIIQVALDLKI